MKLFIQPGGGLANRMRVIDSALAITNEAINVIWIQNRDLNCSYHELFKPHSRINIIDFNLLKFYAYPNYLTQKLPFLNYMRQIQRKSLFNNYLINRDIERINAQGKNIITAITPGKNYIETCERFSDTSKMKDYLKPSDEIENCVNKLLQEIKTQPIGLHIRRSDNSDAIKNSPINLFINEIETIIKNNADSVFYLATDDKDVRSQLLKSYPKHIIVYSQTISRNTNDGIKGAFIDFLALSKCSKIIGSSGSSFTFEAAKYGGVPLTIAQNQS